MNKVKVLKKSIKELFSISIIAIIGIVVLGAATNLFFVKNLSKETIKQYSCVVRAI